MCPQDKDVMRMCVSEEGRKGGQAGPHVTRSGGRGPRVHAVPRARSGGPARCGGQTGPASCAGVRIRGRFSSSEGHVGALGGRGPRLRHSHAWPPLAGHGPLRSMSCQCCVPSTDPAAAPRRPPAAGRMRPAAALCVGKESGGLVAHGGPGGAPSALPPPAGPRAALTVRVSSQMRRTSCTSW